MPNMISIKFPGSDTVFEVTDAQARIMLTSLQTELGTLSSLDTTTKTSLVAAINEIKAQLDQTETDVGHAVHFDDDQDLTSAQKEQARTNIDAAGAGEVGDLKSALIEEQTARQTEVAELYGETSGLRDAVDAETSRASAAEAANAANISRFDEAKVPFPISPASKYGTSGQLLRTLGNGSTEWVNVGLPTDEQTEAAITTWLEEHPEATTTVQDGSLTEAKFTDVLKAKTIKTYLTPEMFGAVGDGTTDDTQAVQACLTESGSACYLSKMYAVSSTISLGDHTTLFGAGRGSCGLRYIGPASTEVNIIYVVAIPYDSEFCSVHDITIDGGLKASGICDCYNKPVNTFIGIRTQIFNLNIERYKKYGIYLNGMGSEIKNIYAIGDLNTSTGEGISEIGMYVNGTDNRISDCRLQKNAEYGLYNNGSSNVYVAVKCSVNGTGACVKKGFLDCQLECQENLANGLELTGVTLSKFDLQVNCNNAKKYIEGAELPAPENYGVKMNSVTRCNISVVGRKHSVLGTSNIGNEKAIIFLDDNTSFNNIRAELISDDNREGTLYIDGISAANNIIANGSRYGNKGILTSQGYTLINRDCRYVPLAGVSDVDFDIQKETATLTLATLTGNVNMFSCVVDDVADPGEVFSRIVVIQEIDAGDFFDDNNINTLRLNYPLMLMDNGQYVSPTSTVNVVNYRFIISYFDNLAGARALWFRTSASNNCAYPEHQMTFRIYGLPKS